MNDYRSDEFLMAAEASGMDQLFPQQQQQQQQRQGQAQAYAPLDILTVPSQHQHQHPQLQQGLRPNLFVNGTSVADSESDNEDEFKSKKQQQRGGNNSGAVGRLPVSIKDIASDEDERLLASEEGKKLSSKERRQLRNKVSARHFRLRRKEYITQLEQLIEQKVTEANTLKAENERLALENKKLADALQGLSLSPASYLSPSPSEEVYTPSMPRQPAATATASAPVVSQQTPLVPEFQDYDVLNMPLTQFDSPASYLSMNLFAGAVEQEQEQQPQQQQQQQQQQQRITPRIANLLPTFNARKDANPNSFDWPLAYSLPGSLETDSLGQSSASTGNSDVLLSNVQVFNTIVPESLAELEKEALRAQQERENMERAEREHEARRSTITVELLRPKPDREEEGRTEETEDDRRSREGIWEDACKAAEEVYQRLGLQLAGLSLTNEEEESNDA